MKLAYFALKNVIPELNERVVSPERLFDILHRRGVCVVERIQKPLGVYAVSGKDEFVLIRSYLTHLLFHEVLAHESAHQILHEASAKFLLRKQQIEAEAFSLVCMMPETHLPRICRSALDDETFDLLKRRLKILEFWNI